MSAYVFVGPTLRPEDLRAAGDFVPLSPVAQGDVYRIAQRRPRAIGIVDGYFEDAPSVWHKEILFAIKAGVHVFGSASMGALRAAELHPFGMRGVGQIFEAFRDGRLEEDDEVAVLHGPADLRHVAISEAMVNVRATLERAAAEGIVASASAGLLERVAKGLFYQERSWRVILEHPDAGRVPKPERDALNNWLPQGRVDQKRADALAMLAEMRALLASDAGPPAVDYHFEWTGMWEQALASWAVHGAESHPARVPLPARCVLDEFRLEGTRLAETKARALLRLLARRDAERRRLAPRPRATSDAIRRLRQGLGLLTREQLERWLVANDLDAATLEDLMADEVHIDALEARFGPVLDVAMLDELRLRGDYPRLVGRARRKQGLLAKLGFDDAEPDEPGLVHARLLAWYVEGRQGETLPEDVAAFARACGFMTTEEFYRALAREYLYRCHVERTPTDQDAADGRTSRRLPSDSD